MGHKNAPHNTLALLFTTHQIPLMMCLRVKVMRERRDLMMAMVVRGIVVRMWVSTRKPNLTIPTEKSPTPSTTLLIME